MELSGVLFLFFFSFFFLFSEFVELLYFWNANNVNIESNRMSSTTMKELLFKLEKGHCWGLFSLPSDSLTFRLFSFLEIVDTREGYK